VRHGGRVVTVMPDTWKESSEFKEKLRRNKKSRKVILRREVESHDGKIETFSCFTAKQTTHKRGYRLFWIHSSEKRIRDRQAREAALRKTEQLLAELNVDGIFPILCTDKTLGAKEALLAYKFQPRPEKRFSQFKSYLNAAPLLFKKIERVEATMFLYFLALILQAVIERNVRTMMKQAEIDALPIYPEDRLAAHPTATKIFALFEGASTYTVKREEAVEANAIAMNLRLFKSKCWNCLD
jgi:transposase